MAHSRFPCSDIPCARTRRAVHRAALCALAACAWVAAAAPRAGAEQSDSTGAAVPLTGALDSTAYGEVASKVGPRSSIRVTPVGVPATPLELRGSNVLLEGVSYTPASGAGQGPVRIGWSEIRSVDVKRNRVGTGALIGGAALGASFLLLGATIDAGEHTEANIPAIGALGALLGVCIGAGVGAMSSRWENIYTAPDSAGLAVAPVTTAPGGAAQPLPFPHPRSSPVALRFATEFGGLYRAGPEVGKGARVEDRWTAIWDFGPALRVGDRNSYGLMLHVTYNGPDEARLGALLRVRRGISSRSSIGLAGGFDFSEPEQHGSRLGSTILMADWSYRDLVVPTVMLQLPPSYEETYTAPRFFLGAKAGSKAGFLLGTLVPIGAFVLVAIALSSWD